MTPTRTLGRPVGTRYSYFSYRSSSDPAYGRSVRTVFLLRYLPDPAYRWEISRQLNKGESLHALRRRIFFGQLGQLRRGDPDA